MLNSSSSLSFHCLGKPFTIFCFTEIFISSSRVALIKMFSPFGKIVGEDFMWHTRGPKRGEPRGFAFIEFSTKEASYILLPSLLSFLFRNS